MRGRIVSPDTCLRKGQAMAEEYGRRFDEDTLAKAADDAARQIDFPPGADAVAGLAKDHGLAVQVVGEVVEGKLQIDPAALQEFQRRFPNAKPTFIAVNAPFDPKFSAEVLNG
jgi:hypothetical protein